MRSLISLFAALTFLLLFCGGCQDKVAKLCMTDGTAPKTAVSACGELCERDDAEACDRQVAIANEHCVNKKDKEICRWMCEHATTGKAVYCAAHKALGGGE
jgi:hypothetical protein